MDSINSNIPQSPQINTNVINQPPLQSPAPEVPQQKLSQKIFKSLLVSIVLSIIFAVLFVLIINIFLRFVSGLGFSNLLYEDPTQSLFITLPALIMAIPIFIGGFVGHMLLYSHNPKRVLIFFPLTSVLFVLLWSGFWWVFTQVKASELELGALFTITFSIIGFVSIIPILIFTIFASKILYYFHFDKAKLKFWLVISGLLSLIIIIFAVSVLVLGWYRTKDIKVTTKDKSSVLESTNESKSAIDFKEISKEEFDAIRIEKKSSLKDLQRTQDSVTLLITMTLSDPNGNKISYVNDPNPGGDSLLKYTDSKTGTETIISKTVCAGSGLFSPDYSKVLLTEMDDKTLCKKNYMFDIKDIQKRELDSQNSQWLTWIDNNRILYQKFKTDDILSGGSDLWIEDLIASSRKQITKNVEIESHIYGGGVENFSISPDKQLVAFSNKKGLFIVSLDGASVSQIASDICGEFDSLNQKYLPKPGGGGTTVDIKGSVACREIKWSSDSKKLYVHTFTIADQPVLEKQITTWRELDKGYWEITL